MQFPDDVILSATTNSMQKVRLCIGYLFGYSPDVGTVQKVLPHGAAGGNVLR